MRNFGKTALALLLALCLSLLGACHGQRETNEFVIPQSFDESKEYEITFWAKTTQIKTRPIFIKRQ